MTDSVPRLQDAGIPEAIGIVSGLKGFMVWIGGSLAGMTAILYVCGYLITTAHIYTLGLYGLVDFSKDYFLLEGAKFVLAVVIGIAQIAINPISILAMAIIAPLALAAIFAKTPLTSAWRRLLDWYEPHSATAWATAARFSLYCTLLITSAVIAFDSLRAISFHLQISDLLYSVIDPGRCRPELIQVRDAFLCGRFASLRSAFNAQLWSAIKLIVLSCIAWNVVAKWRWRAWLIGPLLFVTVLLVLLLPMEFGALLKPTRYPVVRIQTGTSAPQSPVKDQFLIDRSERGFTVWDPSTRRVLWIPAGDVARMETTAVRELFETPAGD
jgi:hypothetical protein